MKRTHNTMHGLAGFERGLRLSAECAVTEPPQAARDQGIDVLKNQSPWVLRDGALAEGIRVRNLTPHEVKLVGENYAEATLPPDGASARVVLSAVSPFGRFFIAGQEVHVVCFAASKVIVGLPDRHAGVLLIVSRMVAEAALDRDDLVFPDDLVRNDRGEVMGCRRLGSLNRRPRISPAVAPPIAINDLATSDGRSRSHNWNCRESGLLLGTLDEQKVAQAVRTSPCRESQTPP